MATMDISRNGGDVAFRTAFSDTQDLVQVMCGLSSIPEKNCPVDFRLAALQRKGHPDVWHMDQVLAFCTDECSPMIINGEDVGGNHGYPCALRVHAPGHGQSVQDVGSRWQDASGMSFTLLRVESADALLFLSDNVGPSPTAWHFADRAQGALTCLDETAHPTRLLPQRQEGEVQLTPAIRHIRREALCLKDGQWQEIGGWMPCCDQAEIREEYEIVNPATVAQAIRAQRPCGGYDRQPSLAAGQAMFLHRMTYRIEPDGTILCSFDHEVMQDVHMPCYLGIMHQVKSDVFGGGVWRHIPKALPFAAGGKTVDFTRPFRVSEETLPGSFPLTASYWADPASPPDRQLDFIRRPDGSTAVGFASGFLPVDDGAPCIRAGRITEAATIVSSCKTYPTFAGGMASIRHPHREPLGDAMHFPRLKGTAYKKYFLPCQEEASLYTVPHGEDTYVYMHFYAGVPRKLSLPLAPRQTAELLEATVSWRQEGGVLSAEGTMGYAAFRLRGQ